MNDEQKEHLKQNLINLMESVGNGTYEPPEPPSKTKLYLKKFIRLLASPVNYFVHKRKLKRIKAEMLQAARDIRASQIHTFKQALEVLEALPTYKPNPPWLPWQQPYRGYNLLVNYRSIQSQRRRNRL